jgi:hypothetical protein
VNRYREQVAAAVAAATVCGPSQYAWLGRRSRRLPTAILSELDESQCRAYLVACLREELYASFYCHGGPVAARWGEPEPASSDLWLLEALSAANASVGGWEPGWTVERIDDGHAVVRGTRLRVRVRVGDCDGALSPGGAVKIRMPRELPALSPGFWTALGDVMDDQAPGDRLVRAYWNVSRGGAPALVAALTARLNAEGVPFRLKVADHPFWLARCDAAVLYLDGAAYRAVVAVLRDVAAALTAHLGPAIPAFTLEFAPGVGLAEDSTGESFGLRRSALLADGIVGAHDQGLVDLEERVDAVLARFAQEGVDIEAPYREPALAGRHVL